MAPGSSVETVTPIGDDPYDLHPDELVFRGPQGGALTGTTSAGRGCRPSRPLAWPGRSRNPETGRMEWWPRVHDLRHVFATRLKDLGIDEKDTQTVMGHDRGSKVTWMYQHSPEDVAAQGAGSRWLRRRPRVFEFSRRCRGGSTWIHNTPSLILTEAH
jgi:integrase